MRPVNISFDQHVRSQHPNRLLLKRRNRGCRTGGQRRSLPNRHGRDIELNVVDQTFVPGGLVQADSPFEQRRSEYLARASRRTPSAIVGIRPPRAWRPHVRGRRPARPAAASPPGTSVLSPAPQRGSKTGAPSKRSAVAGRTSPASAAAPGRHAARSTTDRRRAVCPTRWRSHRPAPARRARAVAAACDVNCVRAPAAAATRPSRLVAAFRMTNGRPSSNRRQKRLIQPDGPIPLDTGIDDDSVIAKRAKPSPRTAGKGSSIAATTLLIPGCDDPFGARPGASCVDARLERAVQRRSAGARSGLFEREHFGVRFAGALVRAVTDDDAVIGHDAGADDGVRRRAAEPTTSVLERPPHPPGVVYHFC